MALFSRIFQNRRNSRSTAVRGVSTEHRKRCGAQEFEKSRIRLVLFKDHDLKGRSLLFDSTAVHRVDPQENAQNAAKTSKFYVQLGKSPSPKPASDGGGREDDLRENAAGTGGSSNHPGFTFTKPGSDTKMLGEMMYGSVAMSYKGSTFKVHSIRSPPQVMMTKVFRLSTGSKESTLEGESLDGDSIQSVPGDCGTPRRINNPSSPHIAHSVPMDVPSPPKRDFPDMETEDSGFSNSLTSSTSSLCTSLPSPSSSASNSFTSSMNSMHRRLMRSQTTSLEYNFMKRASDESMVAPSPLPASKRPPNIGAGIIFCLPTDEYQAKELQYFLFSHVMLLESHINKLCKSIEKAFCTKKLFVRNVYEAFEVFVESIRDLYLTPRLPQPVWLSMTTGNTMHRIPICQKFLKDLMICLDKYDTKNTKFFVSTLVTAVLTHHLAWVPTVTPAWATPSRTYLDKHSARWLDAIAKSHPYNPLWAQLSDLYGAIGFPTKLSRTVVVGRKMDVVNRMLYVLSYFIRCSEVLENTDQQPIIMEAEYLEEEPDGSAESCGKTAQDSDKSVSNAESVAISSSIPKRGESLSTSGNIPTTGAGQHFPIRRDLSIQSYELVDSEDPFCSNHENPKNGGTDLMFTDESNGGSSAIASVGLSKFYVANPVCDSDTCEKLSRKVPCSQNTSVISDNFGLSAVASDVHANENLYPRLGALDCESDVNTTAKDLTSCEALETDFSLLHQDLKRLRLEHRENCMESSADSTCTLTQSSDNLQLSNSSTGIKPLNTTEIDIPAESSSISCQLSPVAPLEESRRVIARNVGRENLLETQITSGASPILSPKSRSPCADGESHEYPTILVDGSSLPAGAGQLDPQELRARKESTLSETSSSRSRDDLDSGIFEGGCRYCAVDCTMSRDSSADNLCRLGSRGDVGSSSPNSDDNGVKDCTDSPQGAQKLPHSSPIAQTRVPLERSSSIFDEYFHDDCAPVALVECNSASKPDYKRMASIEGSSSIFDEYLNEPCPDVTNIRVTRSSAGSCSEGCREDPSTDANMFDEYFTGGLESALPEEVVQKQVEDEDEVTTPTRVKRPCSLKLNISTARNSGDFSRQSSVMSSSSKGFSTPTPGKSRKRHQSSVSTSSVETVDFFRHLKELPMPRSDDGEDGYCIQNFERNFGRSLLAGFSDHYLSDFVLHGTKDMNFQAKLHSDLTVTVQEPVLDEPIAEAACVIADTDKWSVRLQTCRCSSSDRVLSQEMTASRYILDTMESVHDLWKLKMSPEFCLMHLEDKLQEIYFKSKVLAEYIRSHQKVSLKELSNVLDFDVSDLPLMLAVAGTHSSLLTLALMS